MHSRQAAREATEIKPGVLRKFSRKEARHSAVWEVTGTSCHCQPPLQQVCVILWHQSSPGMHWDAWCDQDQNDDNLVEVMMIWWGSTPGPHHCCPGQDLQLPALPFPFSCPPLLSPWHQPWLSSLHPSHPCWGLLQPRTCSLLYSHISGRLRAAKTLDLWPFSSRVPDFWQWAVLAGRGRDPTRRCSITFFCSVEHHSFLWAGDQAGGTGLSPSQLPWHGAEHPEAGRGCSGMLWLEKGGRDGSLGKPGPSFHSPSFSARKTKILWLVMTWNLLSLVERAISITDSGITPLG